ncbi:response regulator transcription factor [Cohnella candidum]|uniref:DNA-binding response regulator n=1 Tax=Cohnella candidum TaxID=2674991 RepID=A0A3G3JU10_9BACL|nr:response regulator transcription factor [Cohnella candidum]AYQ71706.1 DNA-binding response regulator [Cohnella candidum]
MPHITVVDDDLPILNLISEYMRKEGFQVSSFADGNGLTEFIRQHHPDALVLDIMMPGANGLALLTELRTFTEMPIVMISAKGAETDRIIGLELGCNDFLAKPFNPRELVGRVKSLLRLVASNPTFQYPEEPSPALRRGNAAVFRDYRRVEVAGSELSLTAREYDLFSYLLSHPDRPFGREQLIRQVWQYDFVGDVRAVDDLVRRLRRKLAEAGSTVTIETVWSFGYKAKVKNG